MFVRIFVITQSLLYFQPSKKYLDGCWAEISWSVALISFPSKSNHSDQDPKEVNVANLLFFVTDALDK
jgi:hypothetical protein